MAMGCWWWRKVEGVSLEVSLGVTRRKRRVGLSRYKNLRRFAVNFFRPAASSSPPRPSRQAGFHP